MPVALAGDEFVREGVADVDVRSRERADDRARRRILGDLRDPRPACLISPDNDLTGILDVQPDQPYPAVG